MSLVQYNYFKSIPEEVLNKFRQMSDEEIITKKKEIDEKYFVGSTCSEEAQQFLAYL